MSTTTRWRARLSVNPPYPITLNVVGSIKIATAAFAGMITLGGRATLALRKVSCAIGLVKARDAMDENNARGETGDVSSKDENGAGAHTSG